MTTLSEITSKEILKKHPDEEFTLEMDFSPYLATGETIATVVSVGAVLLDEDLEDTEDSPNITLANSAISGTLITVHVSDGIDGEEYRLEFEITTSDSNTKEADGRLSVTTEIFDPQPKYKQPDEDLLYSFPFADLLASGDALSSVTSVTAYRCNGIWALTGDTVNLTVGSGSISGTTIESQVSGANAGEFYRVEAVAETDNGDVRVVSGLLVIGDK